MQAIPDNLSAWRKSRRAELIAARLALPYETRSAAHAAIAAHLDGLRNALRGLVTGFCWPIRGEPDLRNLVQSWVETGTTAALPALMEKNAPMRFRRWAADVAMTRGVWNIPIPERTEELAPDVLLIPMVGYDEQGYRLGNGGGYFDRMLAEMAPPPLTIGVALAQSRLATIYPQAYDIPMDCVATEAGLYVVAAGELRPLTAETAAQHVHDLARLRSLPRRQANMLDAPRIDLSSPVCYAAQFPGYFGETDADKK